MNEPMIVSSSSRTFDRMLLVHLESGFAQPVREGVLVDFLEVSVTVEDVDGVGRLANNVA